VAKAAMVSVGRDIAPTESAGTAKGKNKPCEVGMGSVLCSLRPDLPRLGFRC
jgi:hypothetical protein